MTFYIQCRIYYYTCAQPETKSNQAFPIKPDHGQSLVLPYTDRKSLTTSVMPSVLPFKHQPHKMAKDTQTIRLQQSTILCG